MALRLPVERSEHKPAKKGVPGQLYSKGPSKMHQPPLLFLKGHSSIVKSQRLLIIAADR
jgi:hypothetical protein